MNEVRAVGKNIIFHILPTKFLRSTRILLIYRLLPRNVRPTVAEYTSLKEGFVPEGTPSAFSPFTINWSMAFRGADAKELRPEE